MVDPVTGHDRDRLTEIKRKYGAIAARPETLWLIAEAERLHEELRAAKLRLAYCGRNHPPRPPRPPMPHEREWREMVRERDALREAVDSWSEREAVALDDLARLRHHDRILAEIARMAADETIYAAHERYATNVLAEARRRSLQGQRAGTCDAESDDESTG